MSRVMEMKSLLGSLLGDRRSHPNKLLIDHLRTVDFYAKTLAVQQGLTIDEDFLSAICLTHDIGKVHPKFEQRLAGKSTRVNHAKPSAWFTYSLTHNPWVAEVVSRHHTSMRNFTDLLTDWAANDDSTPFKTMAELVPDWPWIIDEEQYDDLVDSLYDQFEAGLNIDDWALSRLLYSLLVAADRIDAIGISSLPDNKLPQLVSPNLPSRSVEIDNWRKETTRECLEKARLVSCPGVYTLTLPTGAGKTLIGLSIAREWAERFGCKSIIYGLPFITIIEQSASVAKMVFGKNSVQEDHSLAYSKEAEDSESGSAWNKMTTLFRYWREPIVLTTLVHLWDAIFNPRANLAMNFHRLSKAVVILDEPQTISPKYWRGLGKVLDYLGGKWGTFFLLMTATQPHISSKPAELAPPGTFFPFARHEYKVLLQRDLKIEDLPKIIREEFQVEKYSGLVVMNRKKAAIKAYRALEDLGVNGPLLFLSGWVTPRRRRIILRYLRLLEKKDILHYLVSTQVVEAGVDLDFGWVFRDLGPLDSIIQVAGRCNRHANKDFLGKVLIAELIGDNAQPFWKNVYNEILVINSREVLQGHPCFAEKEVPDIVDEYYDQIKSSLENVDIFGHLEKGQWGDMPELFEKENQTTVTVFVEETKDLVLLLNELQQTKWTLENRHTQKRLLQEVQQFSIEIPSCMINACLSFCSHIPTNRDEPVFRPIFNDRAWVLGKEAIYKNGLYDPILGFIPPEENRENFF